MFVDNFVVKSWMGLLIELQNISKEPVHMDIIPYGMAALRLRRISRDFVSSRELFAQLSDSKSCLMFPDLYVFIACAMNRYAHDNQMALMFLVNYLYI